MRFEKEAGFKPTELWGDVLPGRGSDVEGGKVGRMLGIHKGSLL